MPYVVSVLGGVIIGQWLNSPKEENPVVKIATSTIIMFIGYKIFKKL